MNSSPQSHFYKANNHRPVVFNLMLWIISFAILIYSFSEDNLPKKIDYIYTGCFLITIIIPVLINLYFLIPKFLKHEKYLIYFSCFILNLVTFTQLNILFFNHLIDYIFPDYYFISYHSNTKLITIFSVFLIGTTLIKLSEDWFYFNRNENRKLKTKNQQIQQELSILRSQINPHFLFNSLNVIYALAVGKKEKITDAIVHLSDILRYIIYDSNTNYVLLKDEVILLKNYIEFQKIRQHQTNNISFLIEITDNNYKIHPMLLLPLIENSFKHGIKGDIENTFINISLTQNNNVFYFVIENNFSNDSESEKDKYSGLGIDHIKKNLDIVYPKKHAFNVSKTENKFTVSLKLFQNEN